MDLADIPAAAALLLPSETSTAPPSSAVSTSTPQLSSLFPYPGADSVQLLDISTPFHSSNTLPPNQQEQRFTLQPRLPQLKMDSPSDFDLSLYAQSNMMMSNNNPYYASLPPFPTMPTYFPLPYALPPFTNPLDISPLSNGYLEEVLRLQHQMQTEFTQAPPENRSAIYEHFRQQLQQASAGLNDEQKQLLLQMDASMPFTLPPLPLDTTTNARPETCTSSNGSMKRARCGSGASGAGAAKMPRKSAKAAEYATGHGYCESDMSGPSAPHFVQTPYSQLPQHVTQIASSRTAAPHKPPRGRKPAAAPKAATAKKGPTTHAQDLRTRKARMAWPKGTFLIRLSDVKVRNGRDHIWLVDNHQLLQRYNNESERVEPDGTRLYHRTDRYTGWLCHEPWHYFPLNYGEHLISHDTTNNRVTLRFPDEASLRCAIAVQELEIARAQRESAATPGPSLKTSRDEPPSEGEGDEGKYDENEPSTSDCGGAPSMVMPRRMNNNVAQKFELEDFEEEEGCFEEFDDADFV